MDVHSEWILCYQEMETEQRDYTEDEAEFPPDDPGEEYEDVEPKVKKEDSFIFIVYCKYFCLLF